jgi:two-component system CheB/CheR fusion protein
VRLLRERTGAEHAVVQPDLVAAAVRRRVVATHVVDADAYVSLTQREPEELDLLADEILGDPAGFFDPGAYERLEPELDRIVAEKNDGERVKIWSIGCAAGEEAYSIAMLGREACERAKKKLHIEVFATDVRTAGLDQARRGEYSADAVARVDDARRARWFVTEKPHGDRRVSMELRKTVIFARHDVLHDAPYGRMDLVVCRNLLPLLREPSRERLLGVVHYALLSSGVLMLGADDRLEGFTDCFEVIDASAGLFRRLPAAADTVRRFLLMSMRAPSPTLAEARRKVALETRMREDADLAVEILRAYEGERSTLAQLEASQDSLRSIAGAYARLDAERSRARSAATSSSGTYARVQPDVVVITNQDVQRISETLSATGTGVFGTTRDRRIVWACGRVLGRENGEAVGEQLDALLHHSDATELANLATAAADGGGLARRAVVFSIQGRRTLLEVQVRPIAKAATGQAELAWFVHEL